MEKYVIWLAVVAAVGALSLGAPHVGNNLQGNDHTPPFLEEYYWLHNPDGKLDNNRIVGGQVVVPNAYPHQVGLGLSTASGSQKWCGGSIISNNYVLTAAHCLDNIISASVIMGAHDRENAAEPGKVTVMVSNSSFIVHSGWNMQTLMNDIALITLPTTVNFTDKIQAISLPTRIHAAMSFEGQNATITGWGHYEIKRLSKYLRQAQASIVSNSICSAYFGSLVSSSTLCLDGSQGRGTCNGDSGGPLIVQTTDAGTILLGLTSFGNPYSCTARWPTAFTRVSSYLDWISMNTGIQIVD